MDRDKEIEAAADAEVNPIGYTVKDTPKLGLPVWNSICRAKETFIAGAQYADSRPSPEVMALVNLFKDIVHGKNVSNFHGVTDAYVGHEDVMQIRTLISTFESKLKERG